MHVYIPVKDQIASSFSPSPFLKGRQRWKFRTVGLFVPTNSFSNVQCRALLSHVSTNTVVPVSNPANYVNLSYLFHLLSRRYQHCECSRFPLTSVCRNLVEIGRDLDRCYVKVRLVLSKWNIPIDENSMQSEIPQETIAITITKRHNPRW